MSFAAGDYALAILGALTLAPAPIAFGFDRSAGLAAAVVAAGLFALAASAGPPELEAAVLVAAAVAFALVTGAVTVLAAWAASLRADIAERGGEIAALRRSLSALVTQVHEAEDRERARIAQELHDGAMQALLVVYQDLIEVAADAPEIERVQQIVTDVLAEMRRTVSDLHPATATHGDLSASVRAIAERTAELGRFEVDVRVDRTASSEHDQLVVTIVRELLTNTAKHANATRVQVAVAARDGEVVARVFDDGVGYAAGARTYSPTEGRVGLAAINERVKAVGGELKLTTPPGGGTLARARLPIARGAKDGGH